MVGECGGVCMSEGMGAEAAHRSRAFSEGGVCGDACMLCGKSARVCCCCCCFFGCCVGVLAAVVCGIFGGEVNMKLL